MKKLGIPEEFIKWFWTMYTDLTVEIRVNQGRSGRIMVERGFMEGHPPSMAAFVLQLVPLTYALEEVITGIKVNEKIHKVKSFADDVKLFLKDLSELETCYKAIEKFEKISGLEMHRDPGREKCQALPFGKHKGEDRWPTWVTVKTSIKVVGIFYTNEHQNLEKINQEQVEKNFYMTLREMTGMKGTILQKVYCVNTYMLTKLWYTAQVIKMNPKKMEEIMKACMNFIYAGENERPVRALNYRPTKVGGLGLVEVSMKARALLMKNMIKQCGNRGDIQNKYGHDHRMDKYLNLFDKESRVKDIYLEISKEKYEKNGSIILSRNEKRSVNIRWSNTWRNLQKIRGLNAYEKEFAWKLTQDMLCIGRRIHRANVDKECKNEVSNGDSCKDLPDLMHTFVTCNGIKELFSEVVRIIEEVFNISIKAEEMVTLSFMDRSIMKMRLMLWMVIKIMYGIYMKVGRTDLFLGILRDLEWSQQNNLRIGTYEMMRTLREKVTKTLN